VASFADARLRQSDDGWVRNYPPRFCLKRSLGSCCSASVSAGMPQSMLSRNGRHWEARQRFPEIKASASYDRKHRGIEAFLSGGSSAAEEGRSAMKPMETWIRYPAGRSFVSMKQLTLQQIRFVEQ